MSMDVILKSDEQPFISPPVNFRNFAYFGTESAEQQKRVLGGQSSLDVFMQETNLSKEDAEKVERAIDVSSLIPYSFNRETDGGLERNRLPSQALMLIENSRRRNAQYKSIALRALRYDNIEHSALARKSAFSSPPEIEIKEEDLEEEEREEEIVTMDEESTPMLDPEYEAVMEMEPVVPCNSCADTSAPCEDPLVRMKKNLIVSISIYLGYTRELHYHEVRLGRLLKVTDRLELTGSHTLLDLKNAFSCPADYAFSEDFSEKKPTIQDFAKNKWPSAMFFIHDTFYVEQNEGFEDPSSPIRAWAENRDLVGPMKVELMSEQKLGDLTCRLGQPYVFIHQGVCEHLVVFNDLFIKDSSNETVKFPRQLVERNFRRIACGICKEASAQWMLVEHDSMLIPTSPAYLCSPCYKEFCFDVDGNKTGEFKAVPYCDRKDIGDGGKFISELRFESDQTKML